MSDREKVIKGLEYHLKELSIGKTCFECPYWGDNPCETQLIADAIALLKEREAVVRCEDCKFRFTLHCPLDVDHKQAPDWFCADGERR